jgi:hypothetical protein
MSKPLDTWTRAEVYEWLIYLDTSPLHDKLRMKLIEPSPTGLTSSISGSDLMKITCADDCLSILTEDVSLAEREQFVQLIKSLRDNILILKQSESTPKLEGEPKDASVSQPADASSKSGNSSFDLAKGRSSTTRDGLELKIQMLSNRVENDAIQLGKEIVCLQEKVLSSVDRISHF